MEIEISLLLELPLVAKTKELRHSINEFDRMLLKGGNKYSSENSSR